MIHLQYIKCYFQQQESELTSDPAAAVLLWSDHQKLSGLHLLPETQPAPQSDRQTEGQTVRETDRQLAQLYTMLKT